MTEIKKTQAAMLLNIKVRSDVFGSAKFYFVWKFWCFLTVNKVSLFTFELIFCVRVYCHNLIAVFITTICQNRLQGYNSLCGFPTKISTLIQIRRTLSQLFTEIYMTKHVITYNLYFCGRSIFSMLVKLISRKKSCWETLWVTHPPLSLGPLCFPKNSY